MPQFSGAPVEFMTDDDIECKRGDGWFLSYAKIAGIVAVFVIGVVAAGFLGWYINSLPRKKPYNALDLLSDEIGDAEPVVDTVTSPFIHPLKYHIELTPVIDYTGPVLLKGWVSIRFCVNNTHSLNELILSAKDITVQNYALSLVESKKENARRKRTTWDEANYKGHGDDMNVLRAVYSDDDDILKTAAENKSILYAEVSENIYSNLSSMKLSTISSTYPESPSNNTKEIKKPNVVNKRYESDLNPSDHDLLPIRIIRYDVNYEKEIHTINLEKDIHEGVYILEIMYHTFMDQNAFFLANYTTSDDESKWLMGTKFKRSEARYLFPLFNDTAHKVVFSLSVDRAKDMITLSNMAFRSLQDASDSSMILDIFDDSPPMAPHNFAFVMGHIWAMYVLLLRTDVLALFWCESKRKPIDLYLMDKLNSIETNLTHVFSVPFPFVKLDLVVLPPGVDENLENPGLIALKQSVFYTNKSSPLVTKLISLKTLIGLMGHQWLDKYLNTNRSHEWIFEGSLIFFQHQIVPKIDLPSESSGSFLVHVHIPMMEVDSYAIARPPHENVNYQLLRSLRDDHAKGACLIRMLHGAINDTAFRNGYKKLITRWERNVTDISDFMNIMEEEASSGLPFYVSLDEAMDSWISQGGYPLVTVVRNYENDSAVVYQEQFVLDRPLESISKLWHIPLTYVNENGNWSSPTKTWFPAEPQIDLHNITGNKSWVVFNVNKTGYYRVHYDEGNWEMLKTALAENHERFPAETRASLIDDVFSLAAMGLVKYEFTFDFIKYMQMKERHHLPWVAFQRHMFKLNTLLYETPVLNDFQEYAVRFVSPLYTEFEKKLKEGSTLTKIAIKLACVFEHAKCLNWTRNVFENAKSDNEIEDVVPSYIRETFYCTIARHGTGKEWNYFTERVLLTEDAEEKKRLLSSFACFQAPWILQSILNEILHENRFKEDEISVILKAFPRNPAAAQAASRFVRANWQEIAQRFSGSYSLLKSFVLSMVNGLTTEQDLEDLQIFRETNYDSMRGTRYAAAIVEANGNFVTMWLKHALPQVENVVKPAEDQTSVLGT